jgi:hypothetical protein
LSGALISAPRSNNIWARFQFSRNKARCKAVSPLVGLTLLSAPGSNNIWTRSIRHAQTAINKGVSPLLFWRLMSSPRSNKIWTAVLTAWGLGSNSHDLSQNGHRQPWSQNLVTS